MLEVGIRVVRGPDWKWGLQDDGEGHCGTVVELGRAGSLTSPEKTVVVQWDSGSRTNYRVGYQNAYDLLVVDNAPAGVKHSEIICHGCNKHGIAGIRWKCESCTNYDLCTQCYMSDKHNLNHYFQRFDTANSAGIQVPLRIGARKLQIKGIFIGAKVVRGPDWDWNNQDGGEGKTGRVIDIRGWVDESGRSVANVMWTSGNTNVYRLGHKGKVDLKYVEYAVGGDYYKDHLPILGVESEIIPSSPGSLNHLTFNLGDKVKVLADSLKLEEVLRTHGLWNEKIKDWVGKIGTVHKITEKGNIKVLFDKSNIQWTFHPGVLTKVGLFSVGDIVKISDDENKVRIRQNGHGFWVNAMKNSLGKEGKIIQIYKDGDIRVCIKDTLTWTLNPACVTLVSAHQNNQMCAAQTGDVISPLESLLSNVVIEDENSTGMDKLVREAAHGHLDIVRDFIQKFPEKVNKSSSGKTCLQVACHQGHKEMVLFLLQSGADVDISDQDGDTALHYSAFGNQAEIMEILISHGADINAVNKGLCTALHIAVNKQHVQCVRMLIENKCNVNIQDSYGDTALHDAIGKDNVEIINLLCSYESVNFSLKNKRGFNVLHQAALKGKNLAAEKLLSINRHLVDIKKNDGFSALHLACLNGHKVVAETLINKGGADINIQNNRKQTPLLLAVSQGLCSIIELLILMKADIQVTDEEGESALHLALIKRANILTEIKESDSPIIYAIHSQISKDVPEHSVAIAIACFLVREGCSLTIQNSKKKTPLDLVANTPYQPILEHFAKLQEDADIDKPLSFFETSQPKTEEEIMSKKVIECSVCSDIVDDEVLFDPCGHKIACEDCARRVKKCLKCGSEISKRLRANGRLIPYWSKQPNDERVKYLETKIQEIEDAQTCSICMERKRNVMFLCGHSACDICSQTLDTCHMCRVIIAKKINFYE